MNDGHRDTWSAPANGWPTFDADGRRIRDDLKGDCSVDCLERCAYPGQFTECST